MNIRQQELKACMKNMIFLAQRCVTNSEGKGNYEESLVLKVFLSAFGVKYSVGDYARKRYFNDFRNLDYFILNEDGTEFTVNFDAIQKNPYGIVFPEPKA